MVRASCVDKNGMKKGAWSKEEDDLLKAYITRYGHWNWRQIPKFAGLSRCGKSCRLRWKNYLQPNVKRGNYTKQEEDVIINLHHQLGKKWSVIARMLPGRTDNEIKNYWHTHLKKRSQRLQNPELALPSITEMVVEPSEDSFTNEKTETESPTQLPSYDHHNLQQIKGRELGEGGLLQHSPKPLPSSEVLSTGNIWDVPLTDSLLTCVVDDPEDGAVATTNCCFESPSANFYHEWSSSSSPPPSSSSCNELSLSHSDATLTHLMANCVGEDPNNITSVDESLDNFWDNIPFGTIAHNSHDNAASAFDIPLLDPADLIYPPPSPIIEDKYFWSYDRLW